MMEQVVAVLDIGKTNKKVAIFDEKMQMRDTRRRKIEPIIVDGLRVEDVATIESWFLEQLRELSAAWNIRAISVATHGAAAVCVGSDGKPSVPPVDYTQEVDEGVRERFFTEMGSPEELQQLTATAEVQPLINVGKLLFFLKERYPEGFARTEHLLLYPQYFAYRLTGVATADITYTGCHTYLWDHRKNDWSHVVDRLGLRHALPDHPVPPAQVIGTVTPAVAEAAGLGADTVVTAGIHDSNSSLIPYLITRDQDFVLNSTGTWCVAMRPTGSVSFSPDEIGKMVFFNTGYDGRPVKTSILMGGLEYETYQRILTDRHGSSEEPSLNTVLLEELTGAADAFILPSVVKGSGQFPDSEARIVEREEGAGPGAFRTITLQDILDGTAFPRAFHDYGSALALVDLSVAIQSVVALRRVGMQAGTEIFIEGGFRNNATYLAVLSALLPDNPIFLTSVEEATAFGAALCGKAALDGRPIEELADTVNLEAVPVEPVSIAGIEDYHAAFLKLLGV
jgi:L-fuculokinase